MSNSTIKNRVFIVNGRRLRTICQAFSRDRYYDAIFCLPEGRLARLYARYDAWLNRSGWNIASRDAMACGLGDGLEFRWWMLGYWIGKPILWLEKRAVMVSRRELEAYEL
jgi:hypothetical protein